jgi:hypothetical protein
MHKKRSWGIYFRVTLLKNIVEWMFFSSCSSCFLSDMCYLVCGNCSVLIMFIV